MSKLSLLHSYIIESSTSYNKILLMSVTAKIFSSNKICKGSLEISIYSTQWFQCKIIRHNNCMKVFSNVSINWYMNSPTNKFFIFDTKKVNEKNILMTQLFSIRSDTCWDVSTGCQAWFMCAYFRFDYLVFMEYI